MIRPAGSDGFESGGWIDMARDAVRSTGSGIRANPEAVAAARVAGNAFGNSLSETAPTFAPGFERIGDAAVSWSYAAIAASVAVGVLAVGFVIWNLRKAVA